MVDIKSRLTDSCYILINIINYFPTSKARAKLLGIVTNSVTHRFKDYLNIFINRLVDVALK